MTAREAVADTLRTPNGYKWRREEADRILAAIGASGEYVRTDALLSDAAVEAAWNAFHDKFGREDVLGTIRAALSAAIESVK